MHPDRTLLRRDALLVVDLMDTIAQSITVSLIAGRVRVVG